MAKTTRLTIAAEAAAAQTPHSDFATGEEARVHEGVTIVPGIGDGLGKALGATAVFRIQSLTTATTFDVFDAGLGFSFSTTSLDMAATSEFSPNRNGPDFEPVTISQF